MQIMSGSKGIAFDNIPRLPKVFLLFAFINFIAGSILGGIMSVRPSLWPQLAVIHGEINPFGWLTFLIYGMTYLVLSLSLRLKMPYPWQGWLHVLSAESGVILIVAGAPWHYGWILKMGMGLQTLVPFVFLGNIMSMVIRRNRKRTRSSPIDKVAQRGTDASLMIFLVAGVWGICNQFFHASELSVLPLPKTPALLTYYGWITGTVLAVALHLYPRFFAGRTLPWWYAQTGQVLWGAGIILILVDSFFPSVDFLTGRVLGLAILWLSFGYIKVGRQSLPAAFAAKVSLTAHFWLWRAAWTFAIVLGGILLWGASLLALPVLHLLFLGWVTTLSYSVGYRVFPLVLNCDSPHLSVIFVQMITGILGAVLLPLGFWLLDINVHYGEFVLAFGGIAATLSALVFLIQWIVKMDP